MALQFSISVKFVLFVVVAFVITLSTPINSKSIISNTQQISQNQGKVFVMYAASLIKTFETSLGPSFEKKTGYIYTGEGSGSVQIANMIIDGQRKPDVFVSAGTITIMKLMMNESSNSTAGGKKQQLHQYNG